MSAPRIAVGPRPHDWARAAVAAGGGQVVDPGEAAEGLVWLEAHDVAGLEAALADTATLAWVQLPFAGVEAVASAGLLGHGVTWTCAKGAYAEPVAEHALALALAGLRHLPERARARSWGRQAATTLYDASVVVLGGGGITAALLGLLAPFRVRTTVLRRHPAPLPGATRTLGIDELTGVLPEALVVFVALALTPETTGIIGPRELALMGGQAWLVNVARGRHVQTPALVDALAAGAIGGAALDVTDPEPLPDGHALWAAPNCLITPHTADTKEMVEPLLARRITTNVRRFGQGLELEGLVDPDLGY